MVKYYIDNVDIATYGVHVSKSDGLLSRPRMKDPASMESDNNHGEVVDLSRRFYEPREIILECFIKAANNTDLLTKFKQFADIFDRNHTRQLLVSVEGAEPLAYQVYSKEGFDIKKTWGTYSVVGTFTLALREPEPVKRVLKFTRTSNAAKTVSITLTSTKDVNVYWGDQTRTVDVSGVNKTVTHDYQANGTYYIVIAGDIDKITALTTTGIVVHRKI